MQVPTINGRATILIVDDEPINISILMEKLLPQYRLLAACNGEEALARAASTPPPDLILLDVMMPEMDGYEVCRRLKASNQFREIPVIFVTAMSDEQDEAKGLEMGAVDYITKPFSPSLVEARINNHIALKQAHELLACKKRLLEAEVEKRTQELAITQDATILALASLAETRDNETGNHIRRTQHYVKLLAETLQGEPAFTQQLDPRTVELIHNSAPLHDIGKVGVPDRVLLKPDKLTEEEFNIMKKHTTLGRDAILHAEQRLGSSESSFLRIAREIAYTHHEKWDGSGYPEGLAGADIPLPGRLMALADVYDALISRRVYKPPFSHEKSVSIIREGRGRQFDPAIVDAFLRIQDQFQAIAEEFKD